MKAAVFRLRASQCVHRALIFVNKTEQTDAIILDSKFEPEKWMIKAGAVRTGNGNLTR